MSFTLLFNDGSKEGYFRSEYEAKNFANKKGYQHFNSVEQAIKFIESYNVSDKEAEEFVVIVEA